MTTTADDVWRLLAELTNAQKETNRRFQETERLLKEQSQETDRLLREQSQETTRLLREQSQGVRPSYDTFSTLENSCLAKLSSNPFKNYVVN